MAEISRRNFLAGTAGITALAFSGIAMPAFAQTAAPAAEAAEEAEGLTLAQLEAEAITQASKAGQDTPETRGEVDATRTYVLQNACDETVTELYIYETPAEGEEPEGKGKNLAGDGLERGEQVSVTMTGGYLKTEAETLFTCEYVAGGETYFHTTMHVEDLLFDKVVYLVAADGVSGATCLSFGESNLLG